MKASRFLGVAMMATFLSVSFIACGGDNKDDPTNNVDPKPSTVKVESVSLSSTTLSLNEGESQTITVTITPSNASNKSYTFSSSNTSIVTVDENGKVTALKSGDAKITVTTADGNKTATCEVTVVNQKRISKITANFGNETEETTYDYDSQGRVVMKTKSIKESQKTRTVSTSYTYDGNTIISRSHGDDSEEHTYKLTDGLIVEEDYTFGSATYNVKYTYDDNGYLESLIEKSKYSDEPESITKTLFEWTDGNLTKLTDVYDYDIDDEITALEYTDIPWPKNMFFYFDGTNMEELFEPLGLFGIMPKNLPSKYIYDDEWSFEIDYTVENGDVTKIIYQPINQPKAGTEIYTIEWE